MLFVLPTLCDAVTGSTSYGYDMSLHSDWTWRPAQLTPSPHMGNARDVSDSPLPVPIQDRQAYEIPAKSPARPRLEARSPLPVTKRKVYSCTYCKQSIKNKWDWKRHEFIHERLVEWKCPDCGWIFNEARWFKIHHKKVHDCQDCHHTDEAKTILLQKEAWGCGFCAQLSTDWDARCNHVARHFERDYIAGRIGRESHEWDHTAVIEGLLKRQELRETYQTLLDDRYPAGVINMGCCLENNNAPMFTWEKSRTEDLTVRLQGQLDKYEVLPLLNLLLDRADAKSSFDPNHHAWQEDRPMRADDIFDRDLEMVHVPDESVASPERFERLLSMESANGIFITSPFSLPTCQSESIMATSDTVEQSILEGDVATDPYGEQDISCAEYGNSSAMSTPEDIIGFGFSANPFLLLEGWDSPSTIDPRLVWNDHRKG
jgi:hypothetical protein